MTNQTTKQTSSVYNKIAELYSKQFSKPLEHIKYFLNKIPKNGKILDAGCGAGNNSGYMTLRGFEVIGIDLSKKMLQLAEQKFPKINFKQIDIKKIKFPPNSFDGILASYSLIHISKKDIPAVLRKLHRFLKKTGILFLVLQEGKTLYQIMKSNPINLAAQESTEGKNLSDQEMKKIIKTYKKQISVPN
jgi:ubiquinone/menaquinone biosynthesis C-methylase UbiE